MAGNRTCAARIQCHEYYPLHHGNMTPSTPSTSGKWPCSVCRKGVGSNSLFSNCCTHWVHKGCSGIRGRLTAVKDYKCRICTGEVVLPV